MANESESQKKYSFDGCPKSNGEGCPKNCPFNGAPSTVKADNDKKARAEFGVRSLNCSVCGTNPTSTFESH